jgi:hypothetical protein
LRVSQDDPTIEGTPTAVENLTATAGNAQVGLTWNEPTDNGGAEITGYEVTMNNWADKVTKTASELSHTFTGLTNGTEYTFKVRAVNAKGAGKESEAKATPQAGETTPTGTWTPVTAGNNPLYGEQDFLCVAYGGGKFVATGQKGLIAYSTDGVTWTETKDHPIYEPSPIYDCTMWSITYGNGKFVAVGEDDMVVYSTDGITWTKATIPITVNDFFSVAYGNGKFVIAGLGRRRAYSEDGINWTAATDDNFLSTLTAYGITYGGGKFVAVGDNDKISYSTDGITWTASSAFNSQSSTLNSVAYGNGKFVVVSSLGAVGYSADGITWTGLSEKPLGTTYICCIINDGNKFMAGTLDGRMGYSTDGTTWTILTINETGFKPGNRANPIYDIAYNGNDTYVAVGGGGCISYLKK